MKTQVRWLENDGFTARGLTGYTLKIDDAETPRGPEWGARPMELLLHGLGGCIGIHLLSIFRKMRVKLADFHMEMEGVRSETVPHAFKKIHIHYIFRGERLTETKVRRAVELSDLDCSARASLNAEFTSSFEFEEVDQPPPDPAQC
jgi:putative redox protein